MSFTIWRQRFVPVERPNSPGAHLEELGGRPSSRCCSRRPKTDDPRQFGKELASPLEIKSITNGESPSVDPSTTKN